MRKLLLCGLFIFSYLFSQAQDFSNKGKDFWVAYGYHVRMNAANGQNMVLYFTSDVTANVKIEIPSTGYVQNLVVPANTVQTSSPIPKAGAQDARLTTEGTSNKGIHITSDKAVVAYAHIYDQNVSGATLLFPTTTLGNEYYSMNFTQTSNEGASNSWFYVIATEDNTIVEITPTSNTTTGRPANTMYTVTLNRGQVHNVMGIVTGNTGGDLTGSKIKSVSGISGGCKRIAVFSGSGKINIGCSNGSADNLIQQVFPKNAWGLKYLTAPTSGMSNNYFRVAVLDPSTIVKFNGVPLSGIINGFYYQFSSLAPGLIEADKPMMVAQYTSSQGCFSNGTPGDPEMILLSPVEQTINDVTLNSTPNFAISAHYINVVMKASDVVTFKLDGINVSSNFFTHPQDANYKYAQFNVSAGQHSLKADSGFNAIAYGFGSAESYGYNAGTNLKDLYQYVSIDNEYATVNFPAGCKNSPFKFSMIFPYQPTSIQWKFNGLFSDTTINSPTADSSWVVNGRTLYKYRLSKLYTINAAGIYPISVVASNPSPDGCNGEQEIEYNLQIFDPPIAGFTKTTNGCLTEPVLFADTTNAAPRTINRWYWNFGDGNTATVKTPSHTYLAPGDFTVKLAVISDVGCLSDTASAIVSLSNPPIAAFSTQGAVCEKRTVTFQDQSTVPAGNTIIKWNWSFGDGNTSTLQNPTHNYATAGTYTVTLVVETSSGCRSVVLSRPVIVNALPAVNFNLPNVCLPVGAAQFTDLSTIADGSQALFTHAWDFGDGVGVSTLANPLYNYSGVGPYNVRLTITSKDGCIKDSVKQLTTIYARPTAQFLAPAEVCLSDSAQFSDQSTAPASSVTEWFWDFADATTANVQNPKKRWAAAGTYQVKLYIKSAIGCISDTITKSIVVNQLPTSDFNTSSPACETKLINFTDASLANSGALNKWSWSFGNGNTSTAQNPTQTYTTAGSYTVTLNVETDKGCKSTLMTKTVVVNAQPVVNFNMPAICLPAGTGQFNDLSTISDGSQAQFAYAWEFGDGGTATQKNPVHYYSAVGPYNVRLRVTSKDGCWDTLTKVMNTVYPQPKANYTVTPEVCLGAVTTYTDNSDGKGSALTQWFWSFGDGGTASTQNATHTYATANTFAVRLYVVTDKGCHSDTLSQNTVANPLPTVNFTTSAPVCETRPITFTDASLANAGNLIKWTWDFGDGGTSLLQSPTHTFATGNTTPYTIILNVETDKGCKNAVPFLKPLTVNYLPRPDFIAPEICLTDPAAQFTNSSTIPDNSATQFTYLWNFGDPNANGGNPNTSALKDPSHRYTVTGPYNVRLTITSKDGCVKDTLKTFIVNGTQPQASFTVNNATTLCSNQDVTITDGSTVDVGNVVKVEVYWDYLNNPTNKTVDDTPTPGKTYTHKYPDAGTNTTYQVRYVVYSGLSCVNQTSRTITLGASPQIQFTTMNDVCEEITPFQITAAREIFGLPGTGTYSGAGVSTSGLFNPRVATPGIHTLTYSFVAANGCSISATQTIRVNPQPVADAGPDRTLLEGGFITLNAKGTGNTISYLWTPASYLDNALIATPKVTAPDDITYRLTVTSADGCVDTDDVFVKVLKAPVVPNAFSPNGDGINDTWNIEFLDSYPGSTVEVYNRYGQIVFSSVGYQNPGWNGRLNGQPLPVGTYYWIINPKNGRKQMNGSVTILR
ncbi:MAG: hypothetical protein RLZZ316_3153 [Bacteroidota bacterium]